MVAIRVEAVCISMPKVRVAKQPQAEAYVGQFGFEGDRHSGEQRYASRAHMAVPNLRQWSAVSTDDVEALCRELGVVPFPRGALGENLRLTGISLGNLHYGTVFEFPSGCRLLVQGQNDPCISAAAELGINYGPIVEHNFMRAALGLRGVVGTVINAGLIRPGDEVVCHALSLTQ